METEKTLELARDIFETQTDEALRFAADDTDLLLRRHQSADNETRAELAWENFCSHAIDGFDLPQHKVDEAFADRSPLEAFILGVWQ